MGQASSPGGADAPDGKVELAGYVGVRRRRIGHKQFQQPLPPAGQLGQRVAHHLIPLIGEDALVNLGCGSDHAGQDLIVVGQDDPLARREAAQALVPRRRGQPGADAVGVLDAVDVLEQA